VERNRTFSRGGHKKNGTGREGEREGSIWLGLTTETLGKLLEGRKKKEGEDIFVFECNKGKKQGREEQHQNGAGKGKITPSE